ncbi:MAG TPA: histidine--tRNA ligase [Candidatus Aphodoplasma excrementigallinarum]|uniref:Histidine--tRNA ligase n=1 Tax=Candidatus Aphodoplasma excrementigallinarum TaxID=2840673 RepID=A0A9D1T076_9FIRM|nr:histidine--tRNA ligase [Candidatus Aphodoplasma excrementigallinarum]
MLTKAPRGTNDILASDSYKWQYIEEKARDLCRRFGYGEIRTPTFEHTELFLRGVGDTTDVVEKQMYTFEDKGNRSITLRPEGTASAARAYIEHNLGAQPLPVKLFYLIPCFRYEKPQAGRLREFHQFGVEVFGSQAPTVDAEIISLAMLFLSELGLQELALNINSIGCPTCRKAYNEVLIAYFKEHYDELCDTCKSRLERNPLRILDCKSPICGALAKKAPKLIDYLCSGCREHFDAVKTALDGMGIAYTVDPDIVRGLDYYTKTVFEITSNDIGSQSAVCGGGRYDGLIEELGGAPTPGIGFALGIERLLMVMEQKGLSFGEVEPPKLYVASIGAAADAYAETLVYHLRKNGISCEKDRMGRSLKAQMKYADKSGYQYTVVLGDDEIAQKKAVLKRMSDGESVTVELDEIENYLK